MAGFRKKANSQNGMTCLLAIFLDDAVDSLQNVGPGHCIKESYQIVIPLDICFIPISR